MGSVQILDEAWDTDSQAPDRMALTISFIIHIGGRRWLTSPIHVDDKSNLLIGLIAIYLSEHFDS